MHGRSVTLHLALLSVTPADADLGVKGKTLRAFIRIDDGEGVLFSIPASGDATISMGDFSVGNHVVRYGVFVGDFFLNGAVRCFRVRK